MGASEPRWFARCRKTRWFTSPAQYHTQAGRALNAAILREIPALGSIVAMELDSERRESDTFPTFMSFDLWNVQVSSDRIRNVAIRGLQDSISTPTTYSSSFGGGEDDSADKIPFWQSAGKRWAECPRFQPSGMQPIGGKADEYKASLRVRVQDSYWIARFKKVLNLTEQDKNRYGVHKDKGAAKLGLAMLLARNVLAADAGARFLWVANSYNGGNGSFDNHDRTLRPRRSWLQKVRRCPSTKAVPGSMERSAALLKIFRRCQATSLERPCSMKPWLSWSTNSGELQT